MAARGGTCIRCGCNIHHWISPTGRTFPAGTEMSDGHYYTYLSGELCPECDKKVPLKEKDPIMANFFERMAKRLDEFK